MIVFVNVWTTELMLFYVFVTAELYVSVVWLTEKIFTTKKRLNIVFIIKVYWRRLTLPILRPFSAKAQGRKHFWKPSKPCHVGIHWIAFTEYSQMSTMYQGFSHFLKGFLHHFVLAKLATSSIRVNFANFVLHFCWANKFNNVMFGHYS